MIDKAVCFYVGCALIPSPPSPCPDFGLQFLAVLVIGLIAPKFLIIPVNIFVMYLGRFCRWFFGLFPGIRIIVKWVDDSLKKFEKIIKRKRKFKNKLVQFIYTFVVKDDIIQRLIFGYFVTIIIGALLMVGSVFVL
ncbi:MAG: hypothetical protein J7L08_00110 [Candidatus Aenigmarchaeota archaeon]|nr:hypothetical protein [Candidatus Aenigmarchaeota archaeon]